MQSFRTELENPIVEKDILDLEKRIRLFREGKITDEKFRSLRLVRGIYGQRQPGVQMVRIKLPFGRLTVKQLLRICEISDEYATSNLHLTTRQDIQIHYVSLDRTPELYTKLAQDDITIREACGNTVRNVTASFTAGIDKNELFDVSPYAYATFNYFLRNPICQDMGRKFKIAFSSSEEDTAFSYIHDLGFIPKVKIESGEEMRGFKVVVGGGLGAQPFIAKPAFDFLPEDQLIPFSEAVIRVFDRYGERTSRNKARLKFLIAKIGFETFMELVEQERTALKSKSYIVDRNAVPQPEPAPEKEIPAVEIVNEKRYEAWLKTNVMEQKQEGFYGVKARALKGDIKTDKARELAALVKGYAADDIRVTPNQGLLFKFVRKEALPYFFYTLDRLGLGDPGFDSTGDVTTCPGTDTCNLGITNSMGAAEVLEEMLKEEYPDTIYNHDVKIKISGCMNSCGQHGLANIGFHGSSIKNGPNVVPALQVLLGGGTVGNGEGRAAERVIKVPSKRGLDVVRRILNDFEANAAENEYFNSYYDRQGKNYFYQLLKPLADLTTLTQDEYMDWGHVENFATAIGVGECAGVMIDLISTLIFEAEEKLDWAIETYENGQYADSIYNSYTTFIHTAKALLLSKDVSCNTHIGIINDFTTHFSSEKVFQFEPDFKTVVLQINQNEPTQGFAVKFLDQAKDFVQTAKMYREAEQQAASAKLPVDLLNLNK